MGSIAVANGRVLWGLDNQPVDGGRPSRTITLPGERWRVSRLRVNVHDHRGAAWERAEKGLIEHRSASPWDDETRRAWRRELLDGESRAALRPGATEREMHGQRNACSTFGL